MVFGVIPSWESTPDYAKILEDPTDRCFWEKLIHSICAARRRVESPLKFSIFVLLIGAFLSASVTGCNTAQYDKPSSSSGTAFALGEVSEDRCLFFSEGEDFTDKTGGDLDYKGGASKGKCLGMRWGENLTDSVSYAFDLKEGHESILVLRAAFPGRFPQFYDVLVDGALVRRAGLHPSGGYGYVDAEWKCFSIPIGQIAQGSHVLTLRPIKRGQIINIDCLVIGKDG